MIKKKSLQKSFATLQVAQCIQKNTWLQSVNEIINWRPIRKMLDDLHSSHRGRPAYDPLLLFKILLLQQWFNLSDPQAEAQVNDRISFKLFLGMDIMDTSPDETTICRFRNDIGDKAKDLFEEINRQFEQKGIIVKSGTIVDASFLKSAARPRRRREESKDEDATWGQKGNKHVFGYKMHIGVDHESGIIRKACLTTAKVHDSQAIEELISGDEETVIGDKAYAKREWREYVTLGEHRIKSMIMRKGFRNHPLTERDKKWNKMISKVRSNVERPFAIIKSKWGHARARYFDLCRNEAHVFFIFIAYNIRRACTILS